MPGYEITYNEFGSEGITGHLWSYVKVNSYQSAPQFSEDGVTHYSTAHTLSGTAMLETGAESLSAVINKARTKLQKVGRNLIIKLDNVVMANVGNDDYSKDGGLASEPRSYSVNAKTDIMGYPRCNFEITKFYGTENAVVNFTFVWMESLVDTLVGDGDDENAIHILSHQWRNRFAISENGLQSWTVEGTLHVMPTNVTCYANTTYYGSNPDNYRALVMPIIPQNFRIKSMNWATDPTGQKLIYSIAMQEHARGLPYPAKTGTGTFSFKKSLDSQAGLLGVKSFSAELEGDGRSNPKALLSALLSASSTRIKWTGKGKDLITSIEVTENDIFSKKRISLRITAKGMPDQSQDNENLEDLSLSGLNFGIFDDFVPEHATLASAPNPYGGALIGAYKKKLFMPYEVYTLGDFPRATPVSHGGTQEGVQDVSGNGTIQPSMCSDYADGEKYYVFTQDVIGIPPTQEDSDLSGEVTEPSKDDELARYLKVKGTERVSVKNNIVTFTSHGRNFKASVPWQVEAPTIITESEYILTRLGDPPPMMFYKHDDDSGIVLEERTAVEAGDIDSNGNKLYTRTVYRKVQLLSGFDNDIVGDDNTARTYTFVDGGDLVLVVNYVFITANRLATPYDPRIQTEAEIESTWQIGNKPDTNVYELDFHVPIG